MATEQIQTPKWEVTVYGLGTVHAGGNHKRARKAFDRAVYQSRHGTGPERGQVVTMWQYGELDGSLGGWADDLLAFQQQQRDEWMAYKDALMADKPAAPQLLLPAPAATA